MDPTPVDVTEILDVTFEFEVVLTGKSGDKVITADNIARRIDSIGYAIVYEISRGQARNIDVNKIDE